MRVYIYKDVYIYIYIYIYVDIYNVDSPIYKARDTQLQTFNAVVIWYGLTQLRKTSYEAM